MTKLEIALIKAKEKEKLDTLKFRKQMIACANFITEHKEEKWIENEKVNTLIDSICILGINTRLAVRWLLRQGATVKQIMEILDDKQNTKN